MRSIPFGQMASSSFSSADPGQTSPSSIAVETSARNIDVEKVFEENFREHVPCCYVSFGASEARESGGGEQLDGGKIIISSALEASRA